MPCFRALTVAVVCLAIAYGAQEAVDPANFFSGIVTALESGQKITVVRTILGKEPEKRAFAIDENTKIDGQLKVKSKVTVRFAAGASGDTAVSIVVRPNTAPKSTKK